jgi:hypothetical protein
MQKCQLENKQLLDTFWKKKINHRGHPASGRPFQILADTLRRVKG